MLEAKNFEKSDIENITKSYSGGFLCDDCFDKNSVKDILSNIMFSVEVYQCFHKSDISERHLPFSSHLEKQTFHLIRKKGIHAS